VLFTEELSAQALDIPLVARKLVVQIVFEGIVRVPRLGEAFPFPESRDSRTDAADQRRCDFLRDIETTLRV
jgi:hypothetical protein